MPTLAGNGTQAATIGTEHTLLDLGSVGVFVFTVDTINMAAGDLLELRIYQIVLTGGTRHVAYKYSYVDAQNTDDVVKKFPPIDNELADAGSIRMTLKQTLGTGRNYDWKVLML